MQSNPMNYILSLVMYVFIVPNTAYFYDQVMDIYCRSIQIFICRSENESMLIPRRMCYLPTSKYCAYNILHVTCFIDLLLCVTQSDAQATRHWFT